MGMAWHSSGITTSVIGAWKCGIREAWANWGSMPAAGRGRLRLLRLRGPKGTGDKFHLATAAQNLRKLAELITEPAP